MLKIIKLSLALFVLLFFSKCRKDCCQDPTNPKCENYDPKYGIPTADFTMRQSLRPYGWPDLKENIAEFSDTIVTSNGGVLFTAKEENAIRYEWTIGDDSRRFYTKEVALRFDDFLQIPSNVRKKIPIKLKVVKKPLSHQNQDDTVYSSERFLVFADEFLWSGTFEGYFEHEPNIKRIIIVNSDAIEFKVPPGTFADRPKDSVTLSGHAFYGLIPKDVIFVSNENVLDIYCYPHFYSYKQWKWAVLKEEKLSNRSLQNTTSGLMSYHANAEFSGDGRHSIVVKYTYRSSQTSPEENYIFKGKKIN
ncbi:MAG: hypothetical protein Q8K70_02090 [Bacteroidota bacterium]|nr:hypothetical protein [Bacteroidota bacterium]